MTLEEIKMPDFDIVVKIKSLENEELINFLRTLEYKGGISSNDYEKFLVENLVEYDSELTTFRASLDEDKLELFDTTLVLLIYEVNSKLEPSKVVVVEDNDDRTVMTKAEAIKNRTYEYFSLTLNPKWSIDDPSDITDDIIDPEKVNQHVEELWESIVARRLPEDYYKVFLDRLRINIIVEKVENTQAVIDSYIHESSNGNVSFARQNKYNYIGHLISKVVPDALTIFRLLAEANYGLIYSDHVKMGEMYKAIIELMPELKWEKIDWDQYKKTTPKSPSSTLSAKGKNARSKKDTKTPKGNRVVASSKEAEEERAKFGDVSHDDILTMSDRIKKRIIGQDEAVDALCRAINVARVGLRGDAKPIGTFLLIGPTGVGKTELAKVLADELAEGNLIRVDCGEYQSEHEISKLFGAPPGYVGFEDIDASRGKTPPATLASKIRENPFSVVLFDEIEKAHEKVYNVLLSIMDEGKITSGRGDECSFNEAVILLTSNIGTKEAVDVCKANRLGFGEDDRDFGKLTEEMINKCVDDRFKPEFLNRLTKTLYFNNLGEDVCFTIVDVLLNKLKLNLEKTQHMTLAWDDSVKKHVCKEGFSNKFGARNLERTIDTDVALVLAEQILKESPPEKAKITLSYDEELKMEITPGGSNNGRK